MTTDESDAGEHVADPAELLREHRGEATGNEGAPDNGDVADPGELPAAHRGETGQPPGRDFGGPALPTRLDLRALIRRPAHHAVSPPEPVARAWAAVQEVGDAVTNARDARREVDAAERADLATEARRVKEAVAAGKPAPKPKSGTRDFDVERRHADAVIAGSEDRASRARAVYDALVAEHAAAWSANVSASLAERHRCAVEAVRTAGAAVSGLRSAIDAAVAFQPDQDRVLLPPHYAAGRGMTAASGWLEAIRAPCESGQVVEPRLDPPKAWRRQVAATQRNAMGVLEATRLLAQVERSEGFAFTDLTRDYTDAQLAPPPGASWI